MIRLIPKCVWKTVGTIAVRIARFCLNMVQPGDCLCSPYIEVTVVEVAGEGCPSEEPP